MQNAEDDVNIRLYKNNTYFAINMWGWGNSTKALQNLLPVKLALNMNF